MTLAIKEPKPPNGKANSSKKLALHTALPLQNIIKVGDTLAISKNRVKRSSVILSPL